MYMCTCDIGSNRHAGTAHMTTEVLLSDLISTASLITLVQSSGQLSPRGL